MKNLFLLVASFCSISCAFAQMALPNSGFENWSGGEPIDWFTNNVTGVITGTKSTDRHSGNFAYRGDVKQNGASNLSPNIGTSGVAPFSFTQNYPTLNFYYKLHRVSNSDGIVFSLSISDSTGYPVGTCSGKISNEASTYQPFSFPITYLGGTPHHCNLLISLEDTTGSGGTLGSYFLLDDISVGGFVSGIQEIAVAQPEINVFPNPATGKKWTISADNFWIDGEVEVMNMAGQTLYTDKIVQTETEISADLPKGVYAIRVMKPGITLSRKLVKW